MLRKVGGLLCVGEVDRIGFLDASFLCLASGRNVFELLLLLCLIGRPLSLIAFVDISFDRPMLIGVYCAMQEGELWKRGMRVENRRRGLTRRDMQAKL